MQRLLKNHWNLILIGLFMVAVVILFVGTGGDSHIAVHDNMDLFIAQFKMMRNTGTFFSHGVSAPFLHGVSRDVLPSELSLYTILYMILPPFAAYIVGYILKVVIATASMTLLVREAVLELSVAKTPTKGDEHLEQRLQIATKMGSLAGFGYGILNLFPAFGIAFASIPLCVYLLIKIYRKGLVKSVWKYMALLLVYPFLSYFSYIGFFILCYVLLFFIILWIRDRKPSIALFVAMIVLSIGYVGFEYRLFGTMLFSDEITIRNTMTNTYYDGIGVISTMVDVFVNGMMHIESVHKYFVMPVCLIGFVVINVRHFVSGNGKRALSDIVNILMAMLIFNSVVYGLYYSESFTTLVMKIVPQLEGFQFSRTVFLSPFLWYVLLFVICYRLYIYADNRIRQGSALMSDKLMKPASFLILLIAAAVTIIQPTRYNDLYSTAYADAYHLLKGGYVDDLSFDEFYSESLFDEIKEDIGYDGQWCAAYGLHPAVLEYNGISTIDGYLGFYPQEYKEKFRKVIAPALERVEANRINFDEWGARCYLYSGTDTNIDMAVRHYSVSDADIYVDPAALQELDCRYIISRIELTNADERGLTLVGTYSNGDSPYTLFVYGVDE